MSHFAITGANGYVGNAIAEFLTDQGHTVVRLQRSTGFVLGQTLPSELLKTSEVLVHCAWDFTNRAASVAGSMALFAQARESGIQKIIFISSMSAYEGCRSQYGQAKLEVEKYCQEHNIAIIRPGLVWSEKAGGMVGKLEKLISLSPVLPYISGAKYPLNLVCIQDLAKLVETLSRADQYLEPLTAAHPQGLFIKDILKVLARRKNKSLWLFPLPWQILWLALKVLSLLPIKIGLGPDNLVGLLYQNPKPDFTAAQKLGLSFESFQ